MLDARQRADRPEEPGWLLGEVRAVLQHGAKPDADDRCVGLVAVEDGDVVSAGRLDIPISDNTHLCQSLILTPPLVRRQQHHPAAMMLLRAYKRGS